jgi:outer membrane protein OmpA-like peptidoglycan-associated protein
MCSNSLKKTSGRLEMNQFPGEPLAQDPQEPNRVSSKRTGAWIFGATALALILVLGIWLGRALVRANRQISRLSQQSAELSTRLERSEKESRTLAQQASQAAASAQAAATERDQANEAQAQSAAEAQSALQAAAAAQEQANQAEQKAEEYRKQREEQLQTLQQVLGQIAETHRTTLGLVMTLGEKSVRFDFDKSDIQPQYRDVLNRIAGVLMTLKGYSIYVYGYTDDIGTPDYNLKLSERRAQAVRNELVRTGIGPTLITTKGFGQSDPRVKASTAQARAVNRRVEIGIVDSTLLFEPLPDK